MGTTARLSHARSLARPFARSAARSAARLAALLAALLAACSGDDGDDGHSYDFGPFTLEPSQELEKDCVQITLHNNAPLYVNSVELTTGPGFHHSNWTFVPETVFPGPDGTFDCDERGYSEAIAAVFGGVIFAQSTQTPHEVQAFPPGVAVKLPRKTKLVANIHLLNATDEPIRLEPNIKLTTIPEADVATTLAGISFQNQALALPVNRESRFTLECDLAPQYQNLLGRAPDFRIYYALAHYHDLGVGLTLDAVRPDGTSTNVYTTTTQVGDTLGGPIDPPFDMTGYAKLRMSCDFFNPRPEVVEWGFGDQEMCVFLAFSDSPYNWGGGVNSREPPQNETPVGDALHYTNPCAVLATDARR